MLYLLALQHNHLSKYIQQDYFISLTALEIDASPQSYRGQRHTWVLSYWMFTDSQCQKHHHYLTTVNCIYIVIQNSSHILPGAYVSSHEYIYEYIYCSCAQTVNKHTGAECKTCWMQWIIEMCSNIFAFSRSTTTNKLTCATRRKTTRPVALWVKLNSTLCLQVKKKSHDTPHNTISKSLWCISDENQRQVN